MPKSVNINDLLKGVPQLSKDIKELNTNLQALAKTTIEGQKAFQQTSKSQGEAATKAKQLSVVEKELQRIENARKKLTPEIVQAQVKLTEERKKARQEAEKALGVEKKNISFTDKLTKSFQSAALKIGAAFIAVKGFIKGLSSLNNYIKETNKQITKTAIQFGVTRDEAKGLSIEIRKIASAFDKDFNEVLKSANILSKEFGISASDSLKLINDGFEKGADVNGEFLELLKEYPAQLKTVGLNASESIALITQTERAGVFSDKGIDAIKEAGIRLRELTPATKSALDAIGLSGDEIQKQLTDGSKSLFEVTKDVSQKLSELPPQSKEVGTAIADIFGGPGEDVGLRFLSTLKDIDLELGNMETSLSDVEMAEINIKKSWEDFIASVIKGDGTISKSISGTIELFSDLLDTLTRLNEGEGLRYQKFKITSDFERSVEIYREQVRKKTAEFYQLTDESLDNEYNKLKQQLDLKSQNEESQLGLIELQGGYNDALRASHELTLIAIKTLDEIYQTEKNNRAEILRLAEEEEAKKEALRQAELDKIREFQQKKNEETKRGAGIEGLTRIEALQVTNESIKTEEEILTDWIKNEEAKRAAIRIKQEKAVLDAKKELIEQEKDLVLDSVDSIASITISLNERQIQSEEERARKGIISEEAAAKRIGEIRKRQARAEKVASLFKIGLTASEKVFELQALAAVQAASVVTAPLAAFTLAQIPIVLGGAALQSAAILAQPMPAFRHGGKMLNQGLARFSEEGSELAILPGGHAVLTPEKETIGFVPKGTQFFSSHSKETKEAKEQNTPKYDELIKETKLTRKAILNQPKQITNLTDKGLKVSVDNGISVRTYINKYMRGGTQ